MSDEVGQAATRVVVTTSDGGPRLVAGPTSSRVVVGGDATGGRLSAVEMQIDAGWVGPPPHVHREVDHLWWVVGGEIELTVDGVASVHGPGDCVFVPAGVAHGFATAATAGAVVLQIDSPRALDGYFRDLADTIGAGPPDHEAVAAVMARHDTYPVAPPTG